MYLLQMILIADQLYLKAKQIANFYQKKHAFYFFSCERHELLKTNAHLFACFFYIHATLDKVFTRIQD